jgi:all-trans-retinol 13,14-reductase
MKGTHQKLVIVGAGLAGLTAAAYLTREGYTVQLIEKNQKCGGMLNSFTRDGYLFDAGARSIENSGIIRPMLKDLGIDLPLLNSPVSIGVGSEVLSITDEQDISRYMDLLKDLYPEDRNEIDSLYRVIRKIVKSMHTIYGFDNPVFTKDFTHDYPYLFKQLLPWFGKFILAVMHMNRMDEPIEGFLRKITNNESLVSIIDQHFFKSTPTFFALGYFYVYLDYIYPEGGTGMLTASLADLIREQGGEILTDTTITSVDAAQKTVTDSEQRVYSYDQLVWAADLKRLYAITDTAKLDQQVIEQIEHHRSAIEASRGGDSIFSLYLGVDLPSEYFFERSNGHLFYTPSSEGLRTTHTSELDELLENFENTSKEQVLQWLDRYCELNTYEISIPSLRDPHLSPDGKTGVIISLLFEYELIRKIEEAHWYDEFKTEVEDRIIRILSDSLYEGLDDHIQLRFSSTPLSIERHFGSSEGGITGWTYERAVPVISDLKKIPRSVRTPFPDILQIGQWAYSPAGIPTAILTGWYAADAIIGDKQ